MRMARQLRPPRHPCRLLGDMDVSVVAVVVPSAFRTLAVEIPVRWIGCVVRPFLEDRPARYVLDGLEEHGYWSTSGGATGASFSPVVASRIFPTASRVDSPPLLWTWTLVLLARVSRRLRRSITP